MYWLHRCKDRYRDFEAVCMKVKEHLAATRLLIKKRADGGGTKRSLACRSECG